MSGVGILLIVLMCFFSIAIVLDLIGTMGILFDSRKIRCSIGLPMCAPKMRKVDGFLLIISDIVGVYVLIYTTLFSPFQLRSSKASALELQVWATGSTLASGWALSKASTKMATYPNLGADIGGTCSPGACIKRAAIETQLLDS